MFLYEIGLQFFAEGSAAAAPAASGVNSAAAAQTGEEAKPGDTAVAENTEPTTDAETWETVRSKYKTEINRELSDTVQKRLRSEKARSADLERRNAELSGFLDELCDTFDADDLDGLRRKIAEDKKRRVEDVSLRDGLSHDEAEKKLDSEAERRRIIRENRELKRREQEREAAIARQRESDRILADWRRQVDEADMVNKYPGFDLDAELENDEKFRDLLVYGRGRVSVENAYVSAHFEELAPQIMQHAANRGAETAAYRFADNANRPVEGALSKNAPTTAKIDPKNLTKAQRQEIIRRVARGEKITF